MIQLRSMAAAWPLLLAFAAVATVGMLLLARRRSMPARQRLAGAAVWGWSWATLFFVLYPRPAGSWSRPQLELVGFGGSTGPVNFLANVLLFLPLGAIPVLGRLRWRHLAVPLAAIGSALIETVQYVGDFGRTADVNDVLANTVGAAIGALLAYAVVAVLRRRLVRASA